MKRLMNVLFIILVFASLAVANQVAGTIEKFDGRVIVYKPGAVRGIPASGALPLSKGDAVRTFKNSNAYIKFADGSKIVVTENSILNIKDIQTVNLRDGKVVFAIQKQENKEGVKIATKTAIIGVKGTQFLVNVAKGEVDVVLKEGKINVKAIKGDFKRYLKAEEEDFNKFVTETREDYEEYKKKVGEEFVEFVKEFTMEGSMAVSIRGNEVKDIQDFKEFEKSFELLSNF